MSQEPDSTQTSLRTSRVISPFGFRWCFLRSSVYLVWEPLCQGALAPGEYILAVWEVGEASVAISWLSLRTSGFSFMLGCSGSRTSSSSGSVTMSSRRLESSSPWVLPLRAPSSVRSEATFAEAVLNGSCGPRWVRLKKAVFQTLLW